MCNRPDHSFHGGVGRLFRTVSGCSLRLQVIPSQILRWDTPQHVLVDDDPVEVIWPGMFRRLASTFSIADQYLLGKDYSNPRVTDFHTLSKPFEDMYDRGKVPRMPW